MPAQLIPASVTLLLAVFSVVPVGIPDYAAVTPNFVLMSAYHWTIYRPEYLPYWVLFVTGLLLDLLNAAPVGITPLLLLLVRWGVMNNRRAFVGRAFPFVWGGFTVAAAGYGFGSWILGGVLRGHALEPRSFAFETVLTIAFFPVLTLVLAWLQRHAMQPR